MHNVSNKQSAASKNAVVLEFHYKHLIVNHRVRQTMSPETGGVRRRTEYLELHNAHRCV